MTDIRDSTPDPAGDMGVSSEREGHTGPGQHGTDGVLDTSPAERDPEDEVAPEQAPGAPEENPVGREPKADYPSLDPRSDS
jgi:hypothetical protein